MVANAHNLIVGSSETTATTLAGATYLLATNKNVMAKMHEELRSTFKTEEEIDLISVQKLEYMFAVLHEALRIYPPVPSAIPRITPAGGSTIGGRYVPPKVCTNATRAADLCYWIFVEADIDTRRPFCPSGSGPCSTIQSTSRTLSPSSQSGGWETRGTMETGARRCSPSLLARATASARSK